MVARDLFAHVLVVAGFANAHVVFVECLLTAKSRDAIADIVQVESKLLRRDANLVDAVVALSPVAPEQRWTQLSTIATKREVLR